MTTQTKQQATQSTGQAHLAGKYLTFQLSDEQYGLQILIVREIIGVMSITDVPRTPTHIRGVINLRGKIIPVLDLRVKFGLEAIDDTDETCIIVVDVNQDESAIQMGILVDTVSEVLDVEAQHIEATPSFGNGVHTEFILGIAKIKDDVKMLLDIERVLSGKDVQSVVSIVADMKPDNTIEQQEPTPAPESAPDLKPEEK